MNNININPSAFANRLKKLIKLLMGRPDNQRQNNAPCFECIKRGGICQPECEKRRGSA